MNLNKYIAKEVDEETIKFLKELKQLREENRLLKERLSHLFESEYISLFDEKTKDGIYKYDIREAGLPIEGLNTSYSTVQKLNKPVATSETAVDHPEHYQGKHECIDEMIALFGVEAVKGFCKCNVHKYRYRAKAKNGQEDLDKADWYMSKLMELEEISVEDSKVDFTTTTYFK